eukprot:2828789-Pleurochrysis_carterae.AAC.1
MDALPKRCVNLTHAPCLPLHRTHGTAVSVTIYPLTLSGVILPDASLGFNYGFSYLCMSIGIP